MSSSCGALPGTGQTLSHSVIPTTVTRQPMEIDESSGDATHVVRVDNYSSRCPCSARRDRTRRHPTATAGTSSQHAAPSGPPLEYKDLGNCAHSCQHCGALFWFEERLKSTPREDRHFLENIRAYNQMFSMTSLGANVDESINNGRGPYVFKISGQLYHWIGSLCPAD
ncbi:hypothetical protein Tco_0100958, partial [Tanacetum coccineum]